MKKIEVRIFRDGNQWCATYPHFENLHESEAGFGDSPGEAVNDLLEDIALIQMAKEVQ